MPCIWTPAEKAALCSGHDAAVLLYRFRYNHAVLLGGWLACNLSGKPLWLSLVFWLPQLAVPLVGLIPCFLWLKHSFICHSLSRPMPTAIEETVIYPYDTPNRFHFNLFFLISENHLTSSHIEGTLFLYCLIPLLESLPCVFVCLVHKYIPNV